MKLTEEEIDELERNCIALYYQRSCVGSTANSCMTTSLASIICRSLRWTAQSLAVALTTIWWVST